MENSKFKPQELTRTGSFPHSMDAPKLKKSRYSSSSSVAIENAAKLRQKQRMAELNEAISVALKGIDSNDVYDVVKGLNFLTKKSFDQGVGTEDQPIQLESHPLIVLSLGSLLDVLNPLKDLIFTENNIAFINNNYKVVVDDGTTHVVNDKLKKFMHGQLNVSEQWSTKLPHSDIINYKVSK